MPHASMLAEMADSLAYPLLLEEAIELLLPFIMREPANTASLPLEASKMLFAVHRDDVRRVAG